MSKVLYPVAAGPRPTQTIGVYHPSDTSLYVESTRDFPPAPNLVTIYNDGNFVTLSYGLIDGEHTLSQLEYIEGDSSHEFPEMSFALRTIDKYDFDAIHEAIESYDSSLSDHENDFNNPHQVNKTQVGLGNVDNTSDADKPISNSTQAAIDMISQDISEHIADVDNPHEVTKAQIGLGNVDNTSDLNKPISIAQQYINTALETSVENVSAIAQSVSNALDFHLDDYGNPHQVNKAQVGLGNVDNTSDINKPVSIAQKEYIDSVQANLTAHENDVSNPHEVTKAQVGLGNVDNTSDVDKPVSTAQQNEIDRVDGDISLLNTAVNALDTSLDTHIDDDHNPHAVTKAQVGLGNADNTSDVNKPVSVAQREAIDEVQTNLDNHEANKSNPHGVTKSQVGLSNADNTSDANKPVSTAQRAAIDTVQGNLDDHEADTSNPHNVTKVQVGLGNVDNTSDANKPVSTATQTALNAKLDDSQLVSTAPLSPAIVPSGGSSNNIPRVDHVHPSETFTLNNVSVSSWVADTDLPGYPYAATISNSNITANHTPIVIFSSEDAMLNNYARVASTADGSVKIYARAIVSGTMTIPTIILVRKI